MGCLQSKKKAKLQDAVNARAIGVRSRIKSAKGGVSFEIMLEPKRPLTPFRGSLTPYPGRLVVSDENIDDRLDGALVRRELHLQEKVKFARQDSEKRAAVMSKKIDLEVEALIQEYGIGYATARGEEELGDCAQSSSA